MKELGSFHGKILVADDEKVNVDFFKAMFSKIGFDVEVAYDGREVLDRVETFSPDLIILDVLMPKLNGYQVAERLKGDPKTKDIPIIVLSAVNDVKEKVDLLGLGIDDYITKPFNFIEILARMRNILKTKFLKDEIEKTKMDSSAYTGLENSLKLFLERGAVLTESIFNSLKNLSGFGRTESSRLRAGESCSAFESRCAGKVRQRARGMFFKRKELVREAIDKTNELKESLTRLKQAYEAFVAAREADDNE